MLSDEVIDKVVERLAVRMEQANEYVLQEIGKSIKKIGTLSPSKAQELAQIMKYGGDYDKIVKKLVEITKLNKKDIYKIFQEVAKKEYEFAEQFYKYRSKKYIKWDENTALQNQVNAIAKLTADDYVNMSRTFAFATRNAQGKLVYTDISKKYQQVLDEAVLNVGQGKESFDSAMQRTLKQLAESGIRTIDYASGKSRRADSAVRMNLKEGLRTLHNEMQEQFGKEFDADGVEISVHANPAPDHEKVQGRQFSNKEYAKLQNGKDAEAYNGITYSLDHDAKNGYRPISELNCYHYTFAIVLGVSEPEYSDKELQQIIDANEKGFELDGKHYSMYEGEQLLRKVELELRKTKDIQILARESDNVELISEAQSKITTLTSKYKDIINASGLSSKINRAKVAGYRRVSTKKLK